MKHYTVEYKMIRSELPRTIAVIASTKYDAWRKATYEDIPTKEGGAPYSAWVSAVTYQNGNYRHFNDTLEGKPY